MEKNPFDFDFNMPNQIPECYRSSEFECYCSPCIPKFTDKYMFLERGKTYYQLLDNILIAFKVKVIAFIGHSRMTWNHDIAYLIQYANGSERWRKSSQMGIIFESKEMFNKWVENKQADYRYNNRQPITKFFKDYIHNNPLMVVHSASNGDIITHPCYKLVGFKPTLTHHWFNCLWIDDNGLHYRLTSNYNNEKIFASYEECANSRQIIDFKDNDSEVNEGVIEISIKITKRSKQHIVEQIIKQGGLVLSE